MAIFSLYGRAQTCLQGSLASLYAFCASYVVRHRRGLLVCLSVVCAERHTNYRARYDDPPRRQLCPLPSILFSAISEVLEVMRMFRSTPGMFARAPSLTIFPSGTPREIGSHSVQVMELPLPSIDRERHATKQHTH
jgi:hypothetical protein